MNIFRRAKFSTAHVLCGGLLFLGWLAGASPASADVKLPSIESDNMVMQQDRVLYFWGLSDPEEIVQVIIGDKRYGATADAKGAWWVQIPPMKLKEPVTIKVKGKNSITIRNVITGDVWLCAGQSNMYAPLEEVDHAPEDIETADRPNIRLFKEEPNCAGDPEFDGGGKWVICTPETAKDFSAIGYFVGRELNEKTNNTIALIQATRAGSSIPTWISKEALEKTAYKNMMGENEENFIQYKKLLEEIKEADESGKEQESLRLNKQLKTFRKKVNTATCAYNALIAPLTPFQLKGVLWYQGENDIGENLKFRRLFVEMIQDWRDQFKFRNLPFYYVQLPPIGVKKGEPEDSYYAELREAQAEVQKSPFTFMAPTIDTGVGKDIPMHPREKKTVAHRLASLVLATQYKEPLKCFGPAFDSMEIEDNAIRVRVRRAEPQLIARGGTPVGFEIAGEDKIFHWADARIDGDSIVVSNKKVKKPLAVRYAWADNPKGNIFSQDDVPLLPFRSDEWAHRKPEAAPSKTAHAPSHPPDFVDSVSGAATTVDFTQSAPAQAAAAPSTKHPKPANGAPFAWPVDH